LIIDTDVLIWYSRGNQKAIKLIHSLDVFSISVITYMEVVQGVRNKGELNSFKKALGILNVKVIQIDELVSTKAMFFVEQYPFRLHSRAESLRTTRLSHSMELADALIGATSIIKQLPLLTGNDKHYRHLPEISIQKFVV